MKLHIKSRVVLYHARHFQHSLDVIIAISFIFQDLSFNHMQCIALWFVSKGIYFLWFWTNHKVNYFYYKWGRNAISPKLEAEGHFYVYKAFILNRADSRSVKLQLIGGVDYDKNSSLAYLEGTWLGESTKRMAIQCSQLLNVVN